MPLNLNRPAVAHIRVDGRSLDVPLGELGLTSGAGDLDVKRAVARHLEMPAESLFGHVVDRHETGNLTVRPEAVFG